MPFVWASSTRVSQTDSIWYKEKRKIYKKIDSQHRKLNGFKD